MPIPLSSRAGTIAGTFTIASSILLVATIAIASTGGTAGLGTLGVPQPGSLTLLGAILAGAVGLGTIGIVGPAPLDARRSRAGLLVLAGGLAALTTSSVIAMTLTTDPLEHWPALIAGFAGLLGLAIGAPLAVVGLLLTRGRPRRLALVFVGGLGLVTIAGNIALSLLMRGAVREDARPVYVASIAVAAAGGAAMLAAYAGIGWLAIVGGRRPTEASK